MTYLSWPPPNMKLITEVCDGLVNDSLTLFIGNTGLLADSGPMTSYDLRSREGLSAILCLPSTGLKCKLHKSVSSLRGPRRSSGGLFRDHYNPLFFF